ncbi:MAG TPA: ribosome recycling factor [Polyangiaceae bacterium LLY-WYZ-14_1]|jgi:ribosome recycling factor|nr:ribosome recycling factor [Polyangiaceae bacterium LLY-WYZ-14_1]
MIDDTLQELENAIGKAHDALRRELSKLRTGRANPDILAGIRVDYYGTPTPLNQMAAVNVPEPRMLTVKPWEKNQLRPIEKAILESDLGLNPQNDGEILRLPLPPLTEERRKELVKVAKKYGEDCRVAIRKARHDAKDMLDTLEKDGDVGQDEADRARKKVEEIVQAGNGKVDDIVTAKEKDILTV